MARRWIEALAGSALGFLCLANGEQAARAADAAPAAAPKVIRLWEGDAPGAQGKEDNDVPTLTVYPPADGKGNGAALVVCPGGGYGFLAGHEGKPVAEWFNTLGGTGFVLKYRLGPKYHHPVEMHDVQRALRMVRSLAGEMHLDMHKVGVLGFSAGGHLASTAATHFDDGDAAASDPVDKLSCRPDFAVLIYPVIELNLPYAHMGSRQNLLGNTASQDLVDLLSNDKQVTDKTPPTFLVHSADDGAVPPENSIEFFQACRKHHVPVELHLLEHGGHGYGLGGNDPDLQWSAICGKWLKVRKVVSAEK